MLFFISNWTRAESNFPAPYVGNSLDGKPCNGNPRGYGPFDYSKRQSIRAYDLEIVEGRHFTDNVENLIKGETTTSPFGDLDYTLRAWPNHHRALLSMIHYQLKLDNNLVSDSTATVRAECYLQRAINFSLKDPVPYSLYGYYLKKKGKLEKSEIYYKKAADIEPKNAKIAFSYSLLLIDLKRYEEAMKYARTAYEEGNPPETLRKKLKEIGVWKE